jgi:hypothetical protein
VVVVELAGAELVRVVMVWVVLGPEPVVEMTETV